MVRDNPSISEKAQRSHTGDVLQSLPPGQPWLSYIAMASPTRQFGRLSIGGNMPDSQRRGETYSHEESPIPSDDDSGSVENSSESESGNDDEEELVESSTLQARSGITYDLAGLDPDSEARAFVGLTGQFDVVECVAAQGGYDFQLSEQPRVHVGSDRDTCSCSAFQRQPNTACQHIYVSALRQRKPVLTSQVAS